MVDLRKKCFLKIFDFKEEEIRYLLDLAKDFKTNDLCVGKRTYQEKNNTGTVECSAVYENAKLGLPYLSEFFQASLDKNCLDI